MPASPAGASTLHGSGRRRVSPDAAIAVLVLIWGSNFSVVKAALREFQPLAFNAGRFVVASALVLLFLRLAGRPLAIGRRDWPGLLALGLVGNTLYQVLFIFGLDWTLAGNTALMLSTVPIFVALLSVLLRHEGIGRLGWAGVLVSGFGIALVVWGGSRAVSFGSDTIRGDLTVLAAALAWSVYTVASSRYVGRYGALPVTAVAMWTGTLGLLVVGAPAMASQAWGSISAAAWAGLLYSGAFAIALAYLIWSYGVRHLGSSRTAVYSNTIPVVALLVAWPTLGEVPTGLQVAGTALILGGIALARRSRPDPAPGAAACPPE
ncbi:MAG: DMT family transporter [Gemmatimonadota bacterium]